MSAAGMVKMSQAVGKSEHFLLKNGFIKDGREIAVPGYTVIVMGKQL